MSDESVAVRKRVIQAMTFLYKLCLKWLCQAKNITDKMEAVWSGMTGMKSLIVAMVDSDNDGIRTHAIKFIEMLVLAQSHNESTVKKGADFSLDDIPMTLKVRKKAKILAKYSIMFLGECAQHELYHSRRRIHQSSEQSERVHNFGSRVV